MRVGDSVRLDPEVRSIRTHDPYGVIVDMAAGCRVLNVGAAGNASCYRTHGQDGWLHKRLADKAARIVGLDIDADEIAAARALGYDIVAGNCENIRLDESFDLIVLSDVIEHLNNPGLALANLAGHMASGGRLVITTPNATFAGNFLKTLRRRPLDVYWDHVALYAPEHIQALCDRHGYRLEAVAYYTLRDRRNLATKTKSAAMAALGWLSPGLHGAFFCVISLLPPDTRH